MYLQNSRRKTRRSAFRRISLFRISFSVIAMVNVFKNALQTRSGDISPGDIVLEPLLSLSTIRGTQKEFQKGSLDVSVEILDERLQNLHFPGGPFSGSVFESLLW